MKLKEQISNWKYNTTLEYGVLNLQNVFRTVNVKEAISTLTDNQIRAKVIDYLLYNYRSSLDGDVILILEDLIEELEKNNEKNINDL